MCPQNRLFFKNNSGKREATFCLQTAPQEEEGLLEEVLTGSSSEAPVMTGCDTREKQENTKSGGFILKVY